jgi:hypothetical protein
MRSAVLGIGAGVLVLACAPVADAQTAPRLAWVDVDYVFAQPHEDETQASTSRGVTAAYPGLQNVSGAGIGAGVWLDPLFGIMGRYEPLGLSEPVEVSLVQLNASGLPIGDTVTTDNELDRTDHAFDVSVTVSPWRADRVEVRAFAGPTFFRVSQERVSEVTFQQVPAPPAVPSLVGITGVDTRSVSGTGLGWNAGGDVAFFFTPNVGLGAGLRVRGGSVEMEDPLSDDNTDLEVGRTSVSIGARFRF